MPFSCRSYSTSRAGPCAATCRQSSEPIEPAAPVTSTVRPPTNDAHPRQVEPDGLAREQVVHLHLAHLRVHDAAVDQLAERRQHAMAHARLARSAGRCGA